MNCSTLRERTAGSPPSTSQVSLITPRRGPGYRPSNFTTVNPPPGPPAHKPSLPRCGSTQPASWVLRSERRIGLVLVHWAEAHEKIARMTLTIKLDRNWSSFQLANRAPPLSVTDSSIAPSARMLAGGRLDHDRVLKFTSVTPGFVAICFWGLFRRSCPALIHQGMPKHAQLARAGARR